MMKQNFKALFIAGLLLSFGLIASAQSNSNNQNQLINTFCNRFLELSSKLQERIENRELKIQEKAKERLNIQTRRIQQDEAMEEKRSEWDQNRSEHFAKLEEKAGTDSQKQALVAFKQAVEAAVLARRTAMDSAIDKFRNSLDKIISSRKSEVDDAVKAYKNAITTMLEKAQSDCESLVSPQAVRTALRQGMETAKKGFTDNKQEIEKIKDEADAARLEFKAAKEKAISDFNSAMEKARQDLKTAWGEE